MSAVFDEDFQDLARIGQEHRRAAGFVDRDLPGCPGALDAIVAARGFDGQARELTVGQLDFPGGQHDRLFRDRLHPCPHRNHGCHHKSDRDHRDHQDPDLFAAIEHGNATFKIHPDRLCLGPADPDFPAGQQAASSHLSKNFKQPHPDGRRGLYGASYAKTIDPMASGKIK
jgi:hypothetical protein